MGFQRSTLKLEFDDPDFAGLEVRASRFSVGELIDVAEFGYLLKTFRGGKEELKGQLKDLYELLEEKELSWNYEDKQGLPVPATAKEFARLDEAFLSAILGGIVQGSKSVPAPLGTPSGLGEMEASLPMEPLPENQAS